jgi:hypothetical protein
LILIRRYAVLLRVFVGHLREHDRAPLEFQDFALLRALANFFAVQGRSPLVLLLLQTLEAQEVLLGVASDLAAGSRANVLFDKPPIFSVQLEPFNKAFVFELGPATVLLN